MFATKETPQSWRKQFKFFPWTDEQLAIYDWCLNGTGHLAIEAVAGSGKTTTLLGIIACLPTTVKFQVLVFNVSVRDKIINSGKIPKDRVKVSTFHQCGRAMLCSYFADNIPEANPRKYNRLAKMAMDELMIAAVNHKTGTQKYEVPPPELEESKLNLFKSTIKKLCDFARLTLTPWNPDSLIAMAKHYNIYLPKSEESLWWLLGLTTMCLHLGEKQAADQRIMDLADYLFLPHHWNLKPRGVKQFCLGDEAQDANRAMMSIYDKFVQQGCRLVLVGDSGQAITGYAGADSNSFATLKARFKPLELPLSTCYRCPVSHIEMAQHFVREIRPKNDAQIGLVQTIKTEEILDLAESEDLIICRFKAPLVNLCLKLIVSGKPSRVRGRDIGNSLIDMVEFALDYGPFPVFIEAFNKYCEIFTKQLRAEEQFAEIENFEDKALAVRYCYYSFGSKCQTVEEFLRKIEDLFVETEDKKFIILSTIHGAKGGEAENVFIVKSNVLPYYRDDHLKWQLKQEENLTYVAITRAKKILYLATDNVESLKHPYGGIGFPEQENNSHETIP